MIDSSLPTRHQNPQGKVASWCRLRKSMEDPATFKPPGTSEVLMVRRRWDDEHGRQRLEVLEGLSSNFFVVDRHGSLRTATDGVLHGYVRRLVMESAEKCGVTFDPRPIYLDDVDEWAEAFITSSSRLIYPISRILLPEHDSDDENIGIAKVGATDPPSNTLFVQYWCDPSLCDGGGDVSNGHDDDREGIHCPKWQQILNEVLQVGGYLLLTPKHRQN